MEHHVFNDLTEVREELIQHPLYKQLTNAERVKILMKHHVFAVWDFMSLLKKLQIKLTCVSLPWMPAPHPEYARFINEIVLGEETDEDGEGGFISHFELYLKGMKEVKADTNPIVTYLTRIKEGEDPLLALESDEIPRSAAAFTHQSLKLAQHGEVHEVAAAFFFGREDLIPDMFQVLVDEVSSHGVDAKTLKYYLNRHIELDGDEHGPLAEKLLLSLCADDPEKLQQAKQAAIQSLKMRIKLWDGVLEEIKDVQA
ncbi:MULTISPECIES: DUF3050 domain-containing protein [Fictibacillus]|uniref:Mangotoxin biosynthesis-involved protein MgoB n=1 Tax=Fictibacillus enclensis TaxID=1017270 RepID=A0A0V8J1M1_9BACL|nr:MULTISPECIES: DUF3050 domain-containing protein [Fictibacillus]KSU80902.1 mangotoxin biosynthesis-involved protein MgoB [Fictibacillus enclensis]RXZ00436.1 DUF3050 domain-containing protein [Fictibacillus sp. S7]SCC32663.1 Protein of unknown function [Fictibacillus enclensis]